MLDKGYDFPLHSMDLLGPASLGADEARFTVPVPQGRLRVAPALRRRGARLSTGACEDAVALALAQRALAPRAFLRFGFDEAWAAAMRHWRREMMAQHVRAQLRAAQAQDGGTRPLVEAGRRLLGRLSLSAQLAGLGGLLTAGRPPWQAAALLGALGEAERRARAHAEALERRGFGPEELGELGALLPQLAAAVAARPGRRLAQGEETARLLTLRAALLGDATLLGRVARQALPQRQHRRLSLRRLLRGAPQPPLSLLRGAPAAPLPLLRGAPEGASPIS